MTRQTPLQKAKDYIRTGDVNILSIGPNTIQSIVGELAKEGPDKKGYLVTRKKLKGRSIDTCQCENHSRFPDGRCAHKDAFVTMLVMKGI